VPRPDVVRAYPGQPWHEAGYRFECRQWLLPKHDYEIGLLIRSPQGDGVVRTPHRLALAPSVVRLDLVHPNGNRYDHYILRLSPASFRAAHGHGTRVSFLDLTGTLVHVDFGGAGTLTVNLENGSGPAAPFLYDQPDVAYLRGHAAINIADADASTSLGIFAVGSGVGARPRAVPSGLGYDGTAHIARVSIDSRDGNFGALRTANVRYRGQQGIVGVLAPDVHFTGPVFIGDIDAAGSAMPLLRLGSAGDVRVAGGSLRQANGQPVSVSGITWLRFVAGQTADGSPLPARRNQAVLIEHSPGVGAPLVTGPVAQTIADPMPDGATHDDPPASRE